MPRAFCPECAAEVPIDEEGRCFLGHEVPRPASSRPEATDATEEPEPWVASVTTDGSEGPRDEATERPPAAPAGDEEEVELDLDTLEQAVAEMGITADDDEDEDEDAFAVFDEDPSEAETDDTAPPPRRPVADEPEVEVHEDAIADTLGAQETPTRPGPAPAPPGPEPEVEPARPEPAPEPEPRPEPEPEPARAEHDEWAAFDEPAGAEGSEEEAEPEPEPEEEPEPVDTANFLARPKGKRRGLFGR